MYVSKKHVFHITIQNEDICFYYTLSFCHYFPEKGHNAVFYDVRVWEESKDRLGGVVVNTTDATTIEVNNDDITINFIIFNMCCTLFSNIC
jgi:hypothetical protein